MPNHHRAVVDIGSNALRLEMLKLNEDGVELGRIFRRYPIRLGRSVFAHRRIDEEHEATLLDALTRIQKLLEKRRVTRCRVVATSAFREARNRTEVVARVKKKTSLQIEIISGREEGRLSKAALSNSSGSLPSDALILDLGGGSLELDAVGNNRLRSLPLGTVRLLERYPELKDTISPRALTSLRKEVLQETRRLLTDTWKSPVAVGTGGNFGLLCQLVPQRGLVPTIQCAGIWKIALKAAKLSPQRRIKELGLRPDRADLLLPACLVVQALCDLFEIQRIRVPGSGIRDGVLRSFDDTFAPTTPLIATLKDAGISVAAAQRRQQDAAHWFSCTSMYHRLWGNAALATQAAGYLRDWGRAIGDKQCLRHTADVVQTHCRVGLSARTRQILADSYVLAANPQAPSTRASGSVSGWIAASVLMGLHTNGRPDLVLDGSRAVLRVQLRTPQHGKSLIKQVQMLTGVTFDLAPSSTRHHPT